MRIGASAVDGIHVDDRAAPGELAAVLDEFLAAVPELDERRRQLVGVDLGAGAHDDRLDRRRARAELLQQRPHAGDDDRRARGRGSRRRHRISSRWPIVSTLGLTRSNGSVSQPGKWTTSSAGRNWRRSSASWPAIVPVGHVTISGRLDDRYGERGDRDRSRHLDHGEAGARVAEGAGEARLVAEQLGQRAERGA